MKSSEIPIDIREEFSKSVADHSDFPLFFDDEYCEGNEMWLTPWHWGNELELKGNTLKELVNDYVKQIVQELEDILEDDKLKEEEEGR